MTDLPIKVSDHLQLFIDQYANERPLPAPPNPNNFANSVVWWLCADHWLSIINTSLCMDLDSIDKGHPELVHLARGDVENELQRNFDHLQTIEANLASLEIQNPKQFHDIKAQVMPPNMTFTTDQNLIIYSVTDET